MENIAPEKLTWEPSVCDDIRYRLQVKAEEKDEESPLMICVVGIPGSGKSTSTSILARMLSDVGAFHMPFDGYHIPMKDLKKFPNATEVIYRRGAPDTFDAEALTRDLKLIRSGHDPVLRVPGFDHARGDPEEGLLEFVRGKHKVVICEGLYLLHDQQDWEKVSKMFDYSIFVDANVDTCMERLKNRNKVLPGYTPEEVEIRVDLVDRANALTVLKSKARAKLVVKSAAA